MDGFKLSVIVPVYEHTEYARACLESVITQLEPAAELVVVDDGSCAETQAMLRGYENTADNISVLFAPHRGAAEARNTGMAAARGEYICFLDCDDLMREGSIAAALSLLKSGADLYIFGITGLDRTTTVPQEEHHTLRDMYYGSVSDFADAYIREREFLIYSQCNKLYKKSLLAEHRIAMRSGMCFGEDRLFNFDYLKTVTDVVTSSHELFYYIKRPGQSLSNRHIPDFFRVLTALNREKVDTFLALSRGTSLEERKAFIGDNFTQCISCTLDRFEEYPEEKAENLPLLNTLAFGPAGLRLWGHNEIPCTADILIVLGCTYCELRIEAALRYGSGNPDMIYLVTGGNPVHDSQVTEAEYMRDCLLERGIPAAHIICENEARNTVMNLEKSYPPVKELAGRIGIREVGIVTEGYHENYVRYCMDHSDFSGRFDYKIYPCFGIWANPDKWYLSESARRNILYNIKRIYVPEYFREHGIAE